METPPTWIDLLAKIGGLVGMAFAVNEWYRRHVRNRQPVILASAEAIGLVFFEGGDKLLRIHLRCSALNQSTTARIVRRIVVEIKHSTWTAKKTLVWHQFNKYDATEVCMDGPVFPIVLSPGVDRSLFIEFKGATPENGWIAGEYEVSIVGRISAFPKDSDHFLGKGSFTLPDGAIPSKHTLVGAPARTIEVPFQTSQTK